MAWCVVSSAACWTWKNLPNAASTTSDRSRADLTAAWIIWPPDAERTTSQRKPQETKTMKNFHPARRALLALGLISALAPVAALAGDFPSRPITFVLPYPAGSGTDQLARGM